MRQPALAVREATNAISNAPRDTISWYQCVAYARWLTDQLQGLTLGELIVGNTAHGPFPGERPTIPTRL